MKRHFKLDSGRIVRLESVSIENTYSGVLEGDPDYISKHILERTPESLRRRYGEYVVIIKPSEARLPIYRFVVLLDSSPLPDEPQWRHSHVSDKVPFGFHWDYSFVHVCWFQNDIGGDLLEHIFRNVRGLEWEAHAKNSAH